MNNTSRNRMKILKRVKEEIQEVLKRAQLDTIEEKNKELVEKIAYLEGDYLRDKRKRNF